MLKKIAVSGLLCCLVVIFLLSAQPANTSAGLSRQITTYGVYIGEQLGLVVAGMHQDPRQISLLDNQFRQLAHSMAFFALALSLGMTLKYMGFGVFKGPMLAFVAAAALAGLDEWHQTFVPGRGMEWRDFISDLQGITIGLALVGFSYALNIGKGGR